MGVQGIHRNSRNSETRGVYENTGHLLSSGDPLRIRPLNTVNPHMDIRRCTAASTEAPGLHGLGFRV